VPSKWASRSFASGVRESPGRDEFAQCHLLFSEEINRRRPRLFAGLKLLRRTMRIHVLDRLPVGIRIGPRDPDRGQRERRGDQDEPPESH
jgi:hypothetical protein